MDGPRTVLVLGGTTEGRAAAAVLAGRPGLRVVSSLAGAVRSPALPAGEVRVGGFGGAGGLAAWLRDERVDAVLDATHPFADGITANAAAACSATGTPLVVLRRPGWTSGPGDRWHRVPSVTAAAAALPGLLSGLLPGPRSGAVPGSAAVPGGSAGGVPGEPGEPGGSTDGVPGGSGGGVPGGSGGGVPGGSGGGVPGGSGVPGGPGASAGGVPGVPGGSPEVLGWPGVPGGSAGGVPGPLSGAVPGPSPVTVPGAAVPCPVSGVLPGPVGRVLLTTGRGGLAAFAGVEAEFWIRAVDPPGPPLPARHTLLLDRGPFTLDEERALFARVRPHVLVTKDSGGDATAAKLVAARETATPVVVVDRPPVPDGVAVVGTLDEALARLGLAPAPPPAPHPPARTKGTFGQ